MAIVALKILLEIVIPVAVFQLLWFMVARPRIRHGLLRAAIAGITETAGKWHVYPALNAMFDHCREVAWFILAFEFVCVCDVRVKKENMFHYY
jgi:hypothetical protein